jgi:putative addiction module CopG family antidote
MYKRHTLKTSLPKPLQAYVNAKLKTGRYANADEVIKELVRAAQQSEREHRRLFRTADKKIRRAMAQADRGEVMDGPAAMERHRAMLRRLVTSSTQRRKAS